MPDLHTERLYLRKMTVADSSDLFNIWSDPEVTKFMNIANFTMVDEAEAMINHLDKLAQENKAIRFSILELKSNKIIGSCGYNALDFENAKTEIGYEIAKQHWGKGYAPEAIAALIDYAFHSLNLHRIEAKTESDNVNSIRILKKLNFTFEGTLREAEKSKGKFIDLNIYSRLKTE